MARVLVVEGRMDPRMAAVLVDAGFDVDVAPPVPDLVTKAVATHEPDAVVFEITQVSRATSSLCAVLMEMSSAPVVIFSERRHEREIVDGFAAGAQSVFSEPIGAHEMVARVRAVLRRMPSGVRHAGDVVAVGPVMLDRARRLVTVRGQAVPVPRKEFEIAEILMRHAGLVVSRRELVREIWGAPRDTKSLDVQVGRLRARLAAAEGRQRILTVRGVGYRFATDDDLDEIVTDSTTAARS